MINTLEVRDQYFTAGWPVVFPIPVGKKFPPPGGVTGKGNHPTHQDVEKVWQGKPVNCNLALRMRSEHPDFDVIAIDIDNYGDKTGLQTIKDLEKSLGEEFPWYAPFSTRRDPKIGTGQFFFKVPKGLEFHGQLGADVDIIQDNHRYSMVYPSVVNGDQYQWYYMGNPAPIPRLESLPWLPEAWRNVALKGAAQPAISKDKAVTKGAPRGSEYRVAINWLRNNTFGFGGDQKSSPEMLALTGPEFEEALTGGAHDAMLKAVYKALHLAMDGKAGLKLALMEIRDAFIEEVCFNRTEGRRERETAEEEFKRAVVNEVDKLSSQKAEGEKFLVDTVKENPYRLGATSEAILEGRDIILEKGIDARNFQNTDRFVAETFINFWQGDVLATRDKGGQEFVVWNPKTRRCEWKALEEMYFYLYVATSERLRYEGHKLLQESIYKEEHEPKTKKKRGETRESEDLRKQAQAILKTADSIESTTRASRILKQVHAISKAQTKIQEFNAKWNLLGLPGGKVLDFDKLKDNPEEAIRLATMQDKLTLTTAVEYKPHAQSDVVTNWIARVVPDMKTRNLLQKILGYQLLGGNPEKLFVVLAGPTNTGKTTLVEACAAALGEYAGMSNAQKILGSDRGGPSPEHITALNFRMLGFSELGEENNISSSALKRLTGNDTQRHRNLHSNEMIEARPAYTPIASLNTIPTIRGADDALAKRIIAIPFEQQLPSRQVPFEEDIIKNPIHQEALLAWMVEGLKMYLTEGLDREDMPEEIKATTKEFNAGVDILNEFKDEELVQQDGIEIEESALWDHYEKWCKKYNVDPKDYGNLRNFRKRFRALGFKILRTKRAGINRYFYQGLGIQGQDISGPVVPTIMSR